MGELTIHESGMIFGPFADSCVFQLEKSALYKGEFRQESIKTCEFVLQKDNKIYFIEAKESCPNYHNASSSDEKRKKYNEYIQDISQKMRDSLNMYMSILLGCNDSSELPRDMHLSDLSEYAIRFVLVVKNECRKELVRTVSSNFSGKTEE